MRPIYVLYRSCVLGHYRLLGPVPSFKSAHLCSVTDISRKAAARGFPIAKTGQT